MEGPRLLRTSRRSNREQMGLLPHDMPKLAWNMAGTQSANERRAAALSSAVGFVVGFVPWIVYWILVGNAPFIVAVLAGLGLAVAINAITLARRQPLAPRERSSWPSRTH